MTATLMLLPAVAVLILLTLAGSALVCGALWAIDSVSRRLVLPALAEAIDKCALGD